MIDFWKNWEKKIEKKKKLYNFFYLIVYRKIEGKKSKVLKNILLSKFSHIYLRKIVKKIF